jgi:hypothetical protein
MFEMKEKCKICGCVLVKSDKSDKGTIYAAHTTYGRAPHSRHHYVAQRFFKTSKKKGNEFQPIFSKCPWGIEKKTLVLCFECHEELLENPVFLPKDVENFEQLVIFRKLAENKKPENRKKQAGRIKLLHEVIETGIEKLLEKERKKCQVSGA